MKDNHRLNSAARDYYESRSSYYKQWMFEHPIGIRRSSFDDLQRVQVLLERLIRHYVQNYKQYVILEPRLSRLLDQVEGKPYRIGTYRTDFVLSEEGKPKLIEITCRYPLNGIFVAGIMNHIADEMYASSHCKFPRLNKYEDIYSHLHSYLRDVSNVLVIKGEDLRNESNMYEEILTAAGYHVQSIDCDELSCTSFDLADTLVICELSFDEWASLTPAVSSILLGSNIINDIRTTFLIHDKRFFVTLNDRVFLSSVLTPEEHSFFQAFLTPTYSSEKHPEIWEEARVNKDNWIIKHPNKGKSVDIYAGIVTPSDEWQKLFELHDEREWVIQKWVPQKTYSGMIKGEAFNDFLAGTLLFIDDAFYGFGDFRMSSFPVTNKGDHRKATSVIFDDDAAIHNQISVII